MTSSFIFIGAPACIVPTLPTLLRTRIHRCMTYTTHLQTLDIYIPVTTPIIIIATSGGGGGGGGGGGDGVSSVTRIYFTLEFFITR